MLCKTLYLENQKLVLMTSEEKPIPSWITDKGNGYYTIDIDAAIQAGETVPIELYKIPQFAPFFTNPPTKSGSIEFTHTQHYP